ncbi:MAG TPA: hypothetical protein VK153_00170 [Candidatus Paceibacterota bacterium]|nr:hypothetical protein [Candidatus Paceibacterota bacterium]
MNNQKDTKKTNINTYGTSDVSDAKSLSNMSSFEFASKKTEKLVTALYMVSDCMDTDDALKGKLRLLGVELLSDIYKLSTLSPLDKHTYISVSLSHIDELLSFIEIAYTIGFISEMNTSILKKEFYTLACDLKGNLSKNKHFTFTLNKKMFELPELENEMENEENLTYKGQSSIKDKRTAFNTMSFTNNKSPLQMITDKKTNILTTTLADREDRTNKIISIIKDKKEVSIKDISLEFTNCSEKTIQRELNALVLKGQLKKTGAKRWSRYAVVI